MLTEYTYLVPTLRAEMLGAFRASRILCDARNQFTKNANKRLSQAQKRNARRRLKIVQENAAIIREGRVALAAVNERLRAQAGSQTASLDASGSAAASLQENVV